MFHELSSVLVFFVIEGLLVDIIHILLHFLGDLMTLAPDLIIAHLVEINFIIENKLPSNLNIDSIVAF